jgi:endonuclease/exonuclease/phosphatase (EEP) superfamily protein YafD
MAVALVLVLLTLVGFLGHLWWIFDLATHFRVQYAVLLAPAAAVLAGLERRTSFLLAAGALAANLGLIIPLYLSTPLPADESATLQILSFNVTASNPERASVIEYLAASGADIIFLHESSTDWEDAVARSDLPYRMISARAPGSVFGTLGLVGEDTVARVVPLGDYGQLSIEVSTQLGESEIKVLGTHPLSPISPVRAAARDEQLRMVGEWAARQDVPVVVTGDFNASTWSRGFSLVIGEAGLVNSQRGFGIHASWPADLTLLGIPIDHLIHSPELTTVDRRLGESRGSDHLPLLVTVARAAT